MITKKNDFKNIIVKIKSIKNFTHHLSYNHRFQKIFREFNIILIILNKVNMKTFIKANNKVQELNNRKYGICCNIVYTEQKKLNFHITLKECLKKY